MKKEMVLLKVVKYCKIQEKEFEKTLLEKNVAIRAMKNPPVNQKKILDCQKI